MWYLLNAYWIPLLLAGLLGVIVGWMSCNNQTIAHNARPSWFSGWVPWGLAAAALAVLAALQMLLPGKQGLLLDTALMLFGAYLLGCCIGCILRPKPAAHLATAGAAKSTSTSGKAATAAAVGTAATAAGLAVAKSASAQTKSTSATTSGTSSTSAKPVSTSTDTTKSSNVANLTSSSTGGINGSTDKVVTTLGAAATGVAATAAAAVSKTAAAAATSAASAISGTSTSSTGDANIKSFTGAAKFGERPVLYNAPRGGGKGDELSLIWGVAEKLEHKMNAAGIWHFDQIANWTQANVEWFEHEFEGFKGRLDRDKWIEQCKKLAAGWRPDGHVGQRPKG
jgi:predicted flap endonuclease-1-like 5' DNA nuclease